MTHSTVLLGVALAATLLCLPARAHDGHDDAPASPAGAALPRFAAASDLFELVGVLDGRQLTVYLDRFADNTPLKGAAVELDFGGTKVSLKEHADGEFEGSLAQAPAPGVIAVTATVTAGQETDLLATDLDLHADDHATPAAHRAAWPAWAGAALAAVVGVVLLARRKGGAA